MEELKRCSFCGGKAKLHKTKLNFMYEEDAYYIYCLNCQAQVRYSDSKEQCVYEWNRREGANVEEKRK